MLDTFMSNQRVQCDCRVSAKKICISPNSQFLATFHRMHDKDLKFILFTLSIFFRHALIFSSVLVRIFIAINQSPY